MNKHKVCVKKIRL